QARRAGAEHGDRTPRPVTGQHAQHGRQRLVRPRRLERLQEDADQALAADTQAPNVAVLARPQVVIDGLWVSRIEHGLRSHPDVVRGAAAGEHALEAAVAGDEHAGPVLAVGGALGGKGRGEDEGLAGRAPGLEGSSQVAPGHAGTSVCGRGCVAPGGTGPGACGRGSAPGKAWKAGHGQAIPASCTASTIAWWWPGAMRWTPATPSISRAARISSAQMMTPSWRGSRAACMRRMMPSGMTVPGSLSRIQRAASAE